MKSILFRPEIWIAKKKVLEQYGTAVTRRLDHLKEINKEPDKWKFRGQVSDEDFTFSRIGLNGFQELIVVHPRYQVGDIVYIKEAWATENQYNHLKPSEIPHTAKLFYMLTDGYYPFRMGIRRTPMFMPAWAARDFIQITDVRAERLNRITEEDAVAEGITRSERTGKYLPMNCDCAVWAYRELWDSINPKYPWISNPLVWVYLFELVDNKLSKEVSNG